MLFSSGLQCQQIDEEEVAAMLRCEPH